FFFSSRRRHTRSKRDWSSDVCSSDLHHELPVHLAFTQRPALVVAGVGDRPDAAFVEKHGDLVPVELDGEGSAARELVLGAEAMRSEERRVGKEGRCGGAAEYGKKTMT